VVAAVTAGAVAVVVAITLAEQTGSPVRRTAAKPEPATVPAAHTRSTPVTTTTTVPPTTVPPTTVPPTTTTTDPGSLPQTGALPTATTGEFLGRMTALWSGVTSGLPAGALTAFFPESAYVQLKDIGDPRADFTGRLEAEYDADLFAAHQLLGTDAPSARLLGVDVDEADAHWVPPGVCDNGIGYYEVPNSRVVYSVDGQLRSFGIASMISWRGEWYVVHLGAILRSGTGGTVESPQAGPGTPTDSSTC
jgi:hypothetical protein